MSSRHAEAGAGAEYVDPRDFTCDHCGRTIYYGLLHQLTLDHNINWFCETCYQRVMDERGAA